MALALAGCSSFDTTLSGDKVDYRSQAGKTTPLEVPPDLTQLARDARYQPQAGVVSATAMQQGTQQTSAAPTGPAVAPASIGEMRIERQGNQRWLVSTLPPEKLWPQVRSFWIERGFTLTLDNAEIGVMETDWAENRAKLPQDFIRNTIGKVFDSLFSTSERDRFRTRIDRSGTGSEIFITHRGLSEIYTNERRDNTSWQSRPNDPQLEAEFLSRLMVRLGAKEEVARATVANAPDQPVRARLVSDQPGAAMEVDEAFDRAWRRVGLALDRGGFTVEDRDRSAGLYYVRYVDPKLAGKEEPGFFSKLFGGGDKAAAAALQRYRLSVKAVGAKTQVSVLNSQGTADNGEAAKLIVARLIDELK
ncbi:outer membrane protein assembly factor BamC [Aquabacterium sp.]|uniref:outer membrane protein assembly factor BamC n=1 Tax=Aquabacterium sp. TaxID=1872578 RepID=UPI002BBE9C52|nr:outer membrane protein assembly factor BamC [Aquabacterium sp.]HSW03205.1 outer membrane protein assembly factor BamC [Aquabacterium sp.]